MQKAPQTKTVLSYRALLKASSVSDKTARNGTQTGNDVFQGLCVFYWAGQREHETNVTSGKISEKTLSVKNDNDIYVLSCFIWITKVTL